MSRSAILNLDDDDAKTITDLAQYDPVEFSQQVFEVLADTGNGIN